MATSTAVQNSGQSPNNRSVKLMVAYRLHLEAANMQAVELVQSGKLGNPRIFSSVFTQPTVGDNSRMQPELGSGTLGDPPPRAARSGECGCAFWQDQLVPIDLQ